MSSASTIELANLTVSLAWKAGLLLLTHLYVYTSIMCSGGHFKVSPKVVHSTHLLMKHFHEHWPAPIVVPVSIIA